MGRYSSVQSYADNAQNARTTSYEQERGSGNSLQTEKVVNPYGSVAGAGSGEFHIYRHARAREQERLKRMDEMEDELKKDIEFQVKVNEWKNEEEIRLEKKRKKREREKSSKMRKKNLSLGGVIFSNSHDDVALKVQDDEFDYKPQFLEKDNTMNTNQSSATQPDMNEDRDKNDTYTVCSDTAGNIA